MVNCDARHNDPLPPTIEEYTFDGYMRIDNNCNATSLTTTRDYMYYNAIHRLKTVLNFTYN